MLIKQMWVEEAEKRLQEYRTGNVLSVPGEDVFSRIQARLLLPAEDCGATRIFTITAIRLLEEKINEKVA